MSFLVVQVTLCCFLLYLACLCYAESNGEIIFQILPEILRFDFFFFFFFSNEYQHHVFSWRNKKKYLLNTCIPSYLEVSEVAEVAAW